MKRLCTLAVLLTSSLASAAGDVAASLESQYYAGLNFGAGWGGGFVVKPSVVFGYHYDQNSKFELEVLSNVKSLKSIGASLLANYRFYPDLDIDPVKLYVSGGLGGYLQIVPFGFGGSSKKVEKPTLPADDQDGGKENKSGKDKPKPPIETKKNKDGKDELEPPTEVKTSEENDTSTTTIASDGSAAGAQAGESVEELKKQIKLLKDAEEAVKNVKEIEKLEKQIKELEKLEKEIDGTVSLSLADKILGSISYKLKVGVDYEITSQIVGAVGITVGGQLSGLKALKMPDATLEVGIRYNF